MAHLDTGQEALAHFLRRCGELFPSDSTLANADRNTDAQLHFNQQYWHVCALRSWRWARKDPPIQFVSIAKQAVTVDSISGTTVTLSDTIATSQAGRKWFLDADGIPCRIDAHTAGTAVLTLVTSYPGSGTSGAGTIFMDEITVASDILAFPEIQELHTGDDLVLIPEAEFRREFPRNIQDHTRAQYACFVTQSKIRLGPWTTDARLFECSYNYRPDPLTFDGVAGTDTPILPRHARELPGLFMLEKIMVDKRDARLEMIRREQATLLRTLESTEASFGKPRSVPRRGARVML